MAVPTVAHAEIGCALLEAGIDVLVEKPIAPTLEEADRLVEAAERNGRILQVGHLERFNPAVIALEQAGDAAAVFRNPPDERLHAAQPRCGCGARSDDPRSRYRARPGARGAEGYPRGRDLGSFAESGYRQRAAGVRGRLHRQSDGQPGFHRKGPQTAPFPAAAVYFGRLCETGRRGFQVGGPEGIAFDQLPIEPAEPLKLQFDAFLDAVETPQAAETEWPLRRVEHWR